DVALSDPVEDRVYPDVGDPGVDALHYDLDLSWSPATSTLTGAETVVFRASADADEFQLDLARALEVSSVTLDGEDASYDHDGKDLVVHEPVTGDQRYTLAVRYAGTPRPVAAPTTRADFSTLGWTVTDDGGAWTMQEPFGAYSWYAVNDQPSDKALYDFTVSAPAPMVGVANGTLESRETEGGRTVTRWHLAEPAASYLTTIAIGRFRQTKDRSPSGVPMSYWTPKGADYVLRGLRGAPAALDWVEQKLGPYPFSSLGILLVDSRSGMETQSMITLGSTDYTTSPEVIVHEIVHQWYGDEVTPSDWRDVWMNEGMAMYLQGVYVAEQQGESVDTVMADWAAFEPRMRRESGPPADYDPATFAEGNVYYGPALMWHELRKRVGDATFWKIVRDWPSAHRYGNADREQFVAWLNEQTGEDLSDFYDAWLLGARSPARTALGGTGSP
ncbi:MAG: peptidase rane alanine aminopeptidase, partial [Nocardioides sp.]|nr:peptidase rane alanine aminopeptidase [Nocardioides sp.]